MFWSALLTSAALAHRPESDEGLRALAYILMGVSTVFIAAGLIYLHFHYRKKRGNKHRNYKR